jgi:hypothetical protein
MKMEFDRKTAGPQDLLWDFAEVMAAEIARVHGWQYVNGRRVYPPWIINPQTDKVAAYHGFIGTWVGWWRGGPVLPLRLDQIVNFLKSDEREWRQ